MCMVSFVGDYWKKDFTPRNPWVEPTILPGSVNPVPVIRFPSPSQEEFDALKKEIEELKKVLIAAKLYDEAMGEPDCEMDEKVELIKKVAELVGVDLSEVFGS